MSPREAAFGCRRRWGQTVRPASDPVADDRETIGARVDEQVQCVNRARHDEAGRQDLRFRARGRFGVEQRVNFAQQTPRGCRVAAFDHLYENLGLIDRRRDDAIDHSRQQRAARGGRNRPFAVAQRADQRKETGILVAPRPRFPVRV
nr:hypothetical protein [Burkholderia sp. AU33803]